MRLDCRLGFIAAIGLAVWARRSFQAGALRVSAAPARTAITRNGPYRFIRHPLYSAALLLVGSAVASRLSVLTLAIGASVVAVTVIRILAEERLLRALCPEHGD